MLEKMKTINQSDILRSLRRLKNYFAGILFGAGVIFSVSAGQNIEASELSELSIEELMDIEVISVSKKKEKVKNAAAAVFVITNEDIGRSGARNIPDALRLAPGVQVSQVDASIWAISIRGFNDRFSDKLLVLIDGRTVYSPLFSGVYWDVQDAVLEDVERIEVVRGPGGTLWGANAITGVINIITRHARDSTGGLVSVAGGKQEKNGALRYGGRVNDDLYYRAYIKYFDRDNFKSPAGNDATDEWDMLRGGFRLDWALSNSMDMTIQGDAYDGDTNHRIFTTSLTPPGSVFVNQDRNKMNGNNLMVKWDKRLSADSGWSLKTYYDQAERDDAVLIQSISTFDVDFQHHFRLGHKQEFVWGVNYRHFSDEFINSFTVSFDPDSRRTDLYGIFIQDKIDITDDVELTLGTKLEHFDYADRSESLVQPNLRMSWKINDRNTLWGAISRALRSPSRSNSDIQINVAAFPGGPPAFTPTVIAIQGNPDFESEELLAFEVGYRTQASHEVSVDVAVFYNDYDNLGTQEPVMPVPEFSPSPHLLIAQTFDNNMEGKVYGVEMVSRWQVSNDWQLSVNYSRLEMKLRVDSSSADLLTANEEEGRSPQNQVNLQSHLRISNRIELDVAINYVGKLKTDSIPAFTRVDLRLGWRPVDKLEIGFVAQNILDDHHPEANSPDVVATETPRSIFGTAVWRF